MRGCSRPQDSEVVAECRRPRDGKIDAGISSTSAATAGTAGQALARARARMSFSDEVSPQMIYLLETVPSPTRYLTRVAVRSTGRTLFVNIEDVHWIKAAENYVELHAGAVSHLLHVPIGRLQTSLDPERFLRIHRSLIVNVREIKELQPGFRGEYVVVLRGGLRLESSRSYHDKIKAWASNPF